MKFYKLLLTLLFISCCWVAAFAQCHIQTAFTYTHSGIVYTLLGSQTGGTGAIQYAWQIDGGLTSFTPNTSYPVTLPTGAHQVCVIARDSSTCYDSTCTTIYSNCNMATAISVQNNGTYAILTANTTGANGTVTYRWSPSSSTGHTLTVQAGATYCVTVTDSTGCSSTACYAWTPAPCTLSATVTNTHTSNNVYTFTAMASGGHTPYNYNWAVDGVLQSSHTTVLTDTFAPGSHTVCFRVQDTVGCLFYHCDTLMVQQNACSSLTVTIKDTLPDGYPYMIAHASGQTGGLTYRWNNTAMGPLNFAPTPNHIYCVTVTDGATGCTAAACDSICTFPATVRDSVSGSVNIFTATTVNQLVYPVFWESTASTSLQFSIPSLYPSFVSLGMIDVHGCFFLDTLYPHACSMFDYFSISHDPANHYIFTGSAIQGTAPYYYDWTLNGYPITSAHGNVLADSLPAGYYTVCATVTDASHCQAQYCDTVNVGQPLPCNISLSVSDSLGGAWKNVTVTDPNSHNYLYVWNTGSHAYTTMATTFTSYCVTVTDGLGCSATACDTGCTLTGYAYHVISGNGWNQYAVPAHGTAPYHYLWSSGDTAQGFYTTAQGIYYVTITDSHGCTVVGTDTVGQVCYFSGSMSISGTSGSGAILTATVYNPHGPVSYHWSNSASLSNVLTVINSGRYCVTATDSIGCSAVICDSVSLGCHLRVQIVDSALSGYHILRAIVDSGSAPYVYYWNPSGTTEAIYVQQSGTYCVNITDHNGCQAYACDTVQFGCHLQVGFSNITYNSANLYTFTGTQTGGSGTVTYYYTIDGHSYGPLTSPSYSATLAQGQHSVCMIAYDANQCTDSVCSNLTAGAPSCTLHSTYTYSHTAANLYTYVAVPGGGTSPYTYRWYIDGQWVATATQATYLANMIPGSHTVCLAVRDAAGCADSICQNLTVPVSPCILAAHISHSITGSVAILTASATGAHGAVSYQWAGGTTGAVRTVTQSGVYCVYLTDTTGCQATVCDTVQIGCGLHAAFTATHTSSNIFTLTGTQTGGTAPYTYLWYIDGTLRANGPNTSYAQTLGVGVHTICFVARGQGGCADSICQSITVTTGCTLSGYVTDTITSSFFTTHHYTAVVLGGTAPYTYRWSTGSTTRTFTAIGAITAPTCVVTDANGCTATLTMNNPCTLHVNTTQQNSGSSAVIGATVSGAHGHVNYHWSGNTSTSNVITVTASGTYCVTVSDSTGCIATSCQYVTLANNQDTLCGSVFTDANANGAQDGTDHGLASQLVYVYSGATLIATGHTNSLGQYRVYVPLGTYTIRYTAPAASAITIPLGSSSSAGLGIYSTVIVSQPNHTYCGYNFGVRDTNVTVSGYVYFDANGDGILNNGETGISGQAVHVGPHVVYTNTGGYYSYVGPAGPYAITYIPTFSYSGYTVTPGSYSVSAITQGNIYAGNSFGLHTTGTACEIATTIIPVTTITAGRPAWYHVYVSNYGNNVASGTMAFYYDPTLIFSYATPVQSSVNTVARFVSFNYSGLLPGQYTSFTINFNAATTVVPNMSTFEMATATDNCNETNFYNNTDTLHQTTTASWDPNVKVVTPAGEGTQGLIHRGQELRYTLNFQNTGTAEAVNIVLTDSISSLLDMSTLRIIGASYPDYAVSAEGHMLVCRFSQIMLPDSNTDEPGSHGYLSFAISPVAGVADGSQIQNSASIYFDYNEAVVTNTTLNTIDYSLSVKELEEHATITVMPNPFSDYTTIRVAGVETHDATLDVYNALGQLVAHATPSAEGVFTLRRGSLSAGIYSYHITQSAYTLGSGKLVIQ